MPIPAPNFSPPFNIVRLGHVGLGVGDLAASRAFYVDLLGFQVTDEDADTIWLRAMEERGHHSLILRRADTPQADALGFRLGDEEDLDRAAAWFRAQDLPVTWVGRPAQGRTIRTCSPDGTPLEFFAEMDRLPAIHQNYSAYRGARPLRIDHCNIFVPDVAASTAFYTGIGFRITEYTVDDDSGGLWAVWLQRKGGVHDIALTNGSGPRLHHVAYWVSNPLVVIDLLDLMATTGHLANIERGPGRHGISNAFFLYVRDPDGHRVELYCSDYQTVDPDHEPIGWQLSDPRRQTLWGAPAPQSWFEHGTRFTDTDLREPVLATRPVIAP